MNEKENTKKVINQKININLIYELHRVIIND